MNDTDRINAVLIRRKSMIGMAMGDSLGVLDEEYVASILKGLASVGYTLATDAFLELRTYTIEEATAFYHSTLTILKELTGANKKWNPMYPNFPAQVMEADEAELFINAIMHYLGDVIGARILPIYEKKERIPLSDKLCDLKVLELATVDDFKNVITNLMASKTSISPKDVEDVTWALATFDDIDIPVITQKEIIALVYGTLLNAGKIVPADVMHNFKNATDVLRLAVALSNGDVSLATKTKFRNFKRKERRFLLTILNSIAVSGSDIVEDMKRHKKVWIRLGEKLHPSEYSNSHYEVSKAFNEIRNGGLHRTFNSKVEAALEAGDEFAALLLLKDRPGDFARRLDHLLRTSSNGNMILEAFNSVVHLVSNSVLLQIMTHFAYRNDKSKDLRIFIPKGDVVKIKAIPNELPAISEELCTAVVSICRKTLMDSYSKKDDLGSVYIDPKLKDFNVPFSQRASNNSLRTVSRGSKLEIPTDKDTLRFFSWWKDIKGSRVDRVDIDLSAVMFNDDWENMGHISYTNLRSNTYHACHSGDITSAPKGACEFIDIDMPSVLEHGGRYILMSVLSYTRQKFSTIPECFCGWMTREHPQSGEIFDARTVEDRLDMNSDTTVAIPLIFDLKERKAIFCDLGLTSNKTFYSQRNVESNMDSLGLMGKSMEDIRKTNLHTLFTMHAEARGKIVNDIADADVVYSVKDGDVTPFDTDVIAGEFI